MDEEMARPFRLRHEVATEGEDRVDVLRLWREAVRKVLDDVVEVEREAPVRRKAGEFRRVGEIGIVDR